MKLNIWIRTILDYARNEGDQGGIRKSGRWREILRVEENLEGGGKFRGSREISRIEGNLEGQGKSLGSREM